MISIAPTAPIVTLYLDGVKYEYDEYVLVGSIVSSMIGDLRDIGPYRKKIKAIKRGDFFKKHLILATGVNFDKHASDFGLIYAITIRNVKMYVAMVKASKIIFGEIENK